MRRIFGVGIVRIVLGTWLFLAVAGNAGAGITLTFDIESLNRLLPALLSNDVAVPLTAERQIRIRLADFRVTGFDPSVSEGPGHVLTSMRVQIPELALDIPLEPRMAVDVARQADAYLLELRFEEAKVRLPLGGSLNVAAAIPPLHFPAEQLFEIEGSRGVVPFRIVVSGVFVGRNAIRFDLDLHDAR